MQDPGRDPREADRLNHPAAEFPDPEKLAAKASHISYCGRFAPSPTGPLHLGSLFTALASYLQARSLGGAWLVRIDDVDQVRTVPGAADAILHTLEAFELNWDGPVVFQSRHTECYRDAINQLDCEGRLYACGCPRRALSQWKRYPGTCRARPSSRSAPHSLRIKTDGEVVSIVDRLQGSYVQDFGQEVGDFIIRRSDGVHAYHLATVMDDAASGVTEVVRGVDLLESTPRQVLLQRVLGLASPAYLHVPVLVDADGAKLSKQTGAAPVNDRDPAQTLHELLNRMGLKPPEDLRGAPASSLLEWALAAWDHRQLRGSILKVG